MDGKDRAKINMLKLSLDQDFDMKGLGEAKKILAIQITKTKIEGKLFIN